MRRQKTDGEIRIEELRRSQKAAQTWNCFVCGTAAGGPVFGKIRGCGAMTGVFSQARYAIALSAKNARTGAVKSGYVPNIQVTNYRKADYD